MKAAFVAAVLLTGGCKKGTNETTAADSPSVAEAAKPTVTAEGMLRFATAAELSDYLDDTEGNNRRNGFVSFGKMADDAYYSIVPEEMFSDMDEVIQFVLDNRDLYQLILGSDGEYTVETRYYDHPYRDVANVDGLFQVGDTVYRIIEGGVAYVAAGKENELKQWRGDGSGYACPDVAIHEFFANDRSWNNIDDRRVGACTDEELYDENTIGNNRITLRVSNNINGPFDGLMYKHGYKYFAKPYHRSIGWWGCNRTITANVNRVLLGDDGGVFTIYDELPSIGNLVSKGSKFEFSNHSDQYAGYGKFSIFSCNCSASTPDAGTVIVHCH